MTITITSAKKTQAAQIARLIMIAMNDECCQYFAGKNHSLEDFHEMMTLLVKRKDSQYSYQNTIVALDDNGTIAGILVCYDGARLYSLRKAFIEEAQKAFSIDYNNMPDETQAGELYLDSLAVDERYRHQGLATSLIKAGIKKAKEMELGHTGLLVDTGNPKAEKLYLKIGFRYVDDNYWGGHQMKHLQY